MTRVLLVDDEVSITRCLRRVLSRHFEVATANDTDEALRLLQEFQPDAVVSDFRMPGMDGAHFLQEVERRCPLALRLMLTGCGDYELETQLYPKTPVGLYGLLRKPWNDQEIVQMLLTYTEREQAPDQACG